MPGDTIHPDELRRRAELRQHAAELHQVPLEELTQLFDYADLLELVAYQASQKPEELIKQPISESIYAKYGDLSNSLSNNTSYYEDDEIEDGLGEDQVIKALNDLKKSSPNSLDIQSAIRARRSAIMGVLYVWSQPEAEVIDITTKEPFISPETDLSEAS